MSYGLNMLFLLISMNSYYGENDIGKSFGVLTKGNVRNIGGEDE